MKTILPAVLFAAFATTSAWAAESVQPLEKIAPYPQAEKGMKRQVIQLTPQEDESKRWKAGAMIIMSLIKLARRFPR